MRSEEGERAEAIASLRRRLGVMTVRCQASSLLGRMETLGESQQQGEETMVQRWKEGGEESARQSSCGAVERVCQAGLNVSMSINSHNLIYHLSVLPL